MGFPWAAVAQAAGNIGGQIWQSSRTKNAQRREFKHNRQMAEYAYGKDLDMWNLQSQWNLDMWNRQNEYNTPAAMMERLRAAGLNPNLIAGQGSAGGQAAAIQKADSPKYQQVRANYSAAPMEMPNLLGLYNAVRSTDAQIDNVRAQTELTNAKTMTESVDRALKSAHAVGKGYANQMAKELTKFSQTFAYLDYRKRAEEVKGQMSRRRLTDEQTALTGVNRKYRGKELQLFQDYGMRSGDRFEYRILMNILEKMLGGRKPW